MGGFQNQLLNQNFKQNFYHIIITALIRSCKIMIENCCSNKLNIPNHEEKIRTHLLENYLENEKIRCAIGLSDVKIRFLPEVLENYDADTNTYIGRTDIRVLSSNWLSNPNDYYIVECKRLDGTKSLNQKYVDEGICRFVGDTPKYSSYNNKNIMLGFVVKDIDCSVVISEITDIHNERIGDIIDKDITPIVKSKDYYLCESVYTNQLSLSHIFYNVSSVIIFS
jgi:hypothetical protein